MEMLITIKIAKDDTSIEKLLNGIPETAKVNISFLDNTLKNNPEKLSKFGSELIQTIASL